MLDIFIAFGILIALIALVGLWLVLMAIIRQRTVDKKSMGLNKDDEYNPITLPKNDTDEQIPTPVSSASRQKVDQRMVDTDIIAKKEKERFVSDDEIRFHAYHLASNDGFKKDSKEYWLQAEKELRI